jgi:hypothetical protein
LKSCHSNASDQDHISSFVHFIKYFCFDHDVFVCCIRLLQIRLCASDMMSQSCNGLAGLRISNFEIYKTDAKEQGDPS